MESCALAVVLFLAVVFIGLLFRRVWYTFNPKKKPTVYCNTEWDPGLRYRKLAGKETQE